jgi:enoyl-[acyl-carrier protein] reductase II
MWLTELLGLRYPLIQGGMAWISESTLAAAVSRAGALGVIAAGNAPARWVADEIDKVKAATDKPFGVNIMLLSPYAGEVARLTMQKKVPVVITGAGDPSRYIEGWKKSGSKVIPVVPSLAFGQRLQRAGVDAVVGEGSESGGHIGKLATMVLVAELCVGLSVPVVAAGGIYDWRSVSAAMMLGAAGVQVGTRFLMAQECLVHPNYKRKLIKARDIDTMVTGYCTGHPVRGVRSKLLMQLVELDKAPGGKEELERLSAGSLQRSAVEGDMDTGSVMAGQAACFIEREESVAEIIADLFDGEKARARMSEIAQGGFL